VRTRLARICLILGALTFCSWPLAFVVDTGLNQTSTYASEYEASGHPWAWLFRLFDQVSGLLIGLGATLAWPLARRFRPAWPMRIVFAATAVIGYTLLATGSLPVDCSDSDGQCRALRQAGTAASWHDQAHHLISDGSGSAFTVALLALVVAVALGAAGPWARGSAVILALLALSTSEVLGTLLWPADNQGIPQRFDEAVEALFFLVLALDLNGRGARPWRWVRASSTRPGARPAAAARRDGGRPRVGNRFR
jgi:hypothetical protein